MAQPAAAHSGPEEDLWDVPRTARFLGVPEQTLYQWVSRRKGPPSSRVGKYRRYDPAKVRRWLAEHEDVPAGGAA